VARKTKTLGVWIERNAAPVHESRPRSQRRLWGRGFSGAPHWRMERDPERRRSARSVPSSARSAWRRSSHGAKTSATPATRYRVPATRYHLPAVAVSPAPSGHHPPHHVRLHPRDHPHRRREDDAV
jgi:hypothetical protein